MLDEDISALLLLCWSLIRCFSLQVFNTKTAELISHHQVEIKQCFPKEGWVEEDPREIMQTVYECMEKTCQKLRQLNVDISNIKAVGVTNQRETTLVWDKETGEPLFNAIVWLDLRTQSTVERLIRKTPGRSKNHLKVVDAVRMFKLEVREPLRLNCCCSSSGFDWTRLAA
ncbi:hypothetical protein ILYODFUR_027578 [Ilyodon furcidens]|uniref:Carbohydrate kinase FGGY N-terminal domain-containing protein n=1 Tax=Ilyodon furcidens TaxID=33524 RepID=A0ABV0UXK2_9TELE